MTPWICELGRLQLRGGAESAAEAQLAQAKMSLTSARAAFERGDLRPILAATLDRPDAAYPVAWSRYVIGAAALMGRIDDAATLLTRDISDLSPDDATAARFYLALGFIRVSRYREAVEHLAASLNAVRKGLVREEGKFFAYQGVAFYRFFQCRYAAALAGARQSWSHALATQFSYGLAIAGDLMGHALLRRGEIAKAMEVWSDASVRASRLGIGGLVENIRISVANSRAAHGLDGDATVSNQETLVASFAPQDNFSRAGAEIELGRLYTMYGRLDTSDYLLEQVGAVVLKAGHRRQKASLLIRLAHNRHLAGRFDECDDLLNDAEQAIDRVYDLDLYLGVLGLRRKSWRTRGLSHFDQNDELIARLTTRTQGGLARNILWREHGLGAPTLLGDDPTGDLKHRAARGYRSGAGEIAAIVRSGMLGLLAEVLPLPLGSRTLCLEVLPGRLLVLDRGNVQAGTEPVSESMRRLAVALGHGPRSKRELVELLWGYDYHPLRHDPLVYTLINRLRTALGQRTGWLLAEAGVYRWDDGVRVYVRESAPSPVQQSVEDIGPSTTAPAASTSGSENADTDLNWRQEAILSELDRRPALSPAECVSLFRVTRVTASRDFAALHARGLVRRVGKGRAIKYALRVKRQP